MSRALMVLLVQFCLYLCQKFFRLDDKSLMGTAPDLAILIIGDHIEGDLLAFHGGDGGLCPYLHADRGGSRVGHIQVSTYGAFVLTDEGQIYDALGRLRAVYPNLMRLEFARESQEFAQAAVRMEQMRSLTAIELFEEFYEKQRQQPLSGEARQVVEDLLEELTHGRGGDHA